MLSMKMAKKITLKNPQTGMIKQAYTGFSWTSLLFGAFPMAFRGDWKAFLIALIISLIAGAFTAGISSIVIGIVLGMNHPDFRVVGALV